MYIPYYISTGVPPGYITPMSLSHEGPSGNVIMYRQAMPARVTSLLLLLLLLGYAIIILAYRQAMPLLCHYHTRDRQAMSMSLSR